MDEMEVDDVDTSSPTYNSDDEYTEYYRNHPSFSNQPYVYKNGGEEEPEPSQEEDGEDEVERVQFARPLSPFVPPSRRKNAPLANILDPTLDSLDPRRYFPDFRPDKVLRFSRIFAQNIKSSSKAEIWWPCKTFHKKALTEEEKTQRDVAHRKEHGQKKSKPSSVPSLHFAPPPDKDQLIDYEDQFIHSSSKKESEEKGKIEMADVAQPWRFGPAKTFYDAAGIPPLATTCNYGLIDSPRPSTSARVKVEADEEEAKKEESALPNDVFMPLNLIHWENDIVYDGDDIRDEVLAACQALDRAKKSASVAGGWIPLQHLRTYEAFSAAVRSGSVEQAMTSKQAQLNIAAAAEHSGLEPSSSHSIFPMENNEVLNARWEDDIIWDDDDIRKHREPKVLSLDLFDDPILFGMPDDAANEMDMHDPKKAFDRKEMEKFTKKSKMVLGQVAQRQKQEEEEQMESTVAQMSDKDAFNLSCDDYYAPKAIVKTGNASTTIQHSIPAQNIHRTFFPTHLNPFKLRHWNRMPLSRRIIRQVGHKFCPIQTLARHIEKVAEQREKLKAAEGGGDIFFMREVSDLSGRDGELLMMEYSEEHPIHLSQPGMASRIRNYHKRKLAKDPDPELDFGEMAFSHHSPFLGQISPGQTLQSIENNLYRAPIHRHRSHNTDFLLIRTKKGWFIRRSPAIFLVGQQCPLYEVPSPNSKRATVFVKDFLMAFIYRLFWASSETPRRLKMEDIKAAFPHYAESSVRKRLKLCSTFTRLGAGNEQNFWVLKGEFRLPSKEEVLAMVTPEMCCAQYSMLAAEQRLKDAGYGEKYFFTPEEGDDDDDQVTMEDEIKCAPWNTSRAFIAASKGKCVLDQTGIADPSGGGQGYSYVRVSSKPHKEDVPQVPKRLVTGTNADLRKLPLKEAKEMCRDLGVKEEEINALTRWEIIDVIRTLSTQAAKAKTDGTQNAPAAISRFARGNIRFNMADMQEKYRKYCQAIFDLQNSVMANDEELSTDEGSSGEESDNEELANRLESMLSDAKGKKGIAAGEKERMEREDEERERLDLKRMLHGENIKSDKSKGGEATEQERKNAESIGKDVAETASKISGVTANKKLKIFRTYKNPDGSESTRVEVITRPQLIEAYARIRMTKDDTFIQVYAQMDEQFKEERRKEKRRLQDQLRRIKRNEQKLKPGAKEPAPPKPKPFNPNLAKMRCSACNGTGHMKTNKNCPLYGKRVKGGEVPEGLNVAMTDEQMALNMPSGELIAVEGTKLKISKKIYQHSEQLKRESVRIHIPRAMIDRRQEEEEEEEDGDDKDDSLINEDYDDDMDDDTQQSSSSAVARSLSTSRRRPTWMTEEVEYLAGPSKSVQRMRADPKVTFATHLLEIVNELRNVENSVDLHQAVNARQVPDYYNVIKQPMDLQTIKMKVTNHKYELRKQFMEDVNQMHLNARMYNGENHIITQAAYNMWLKTCERLAEKQDLMVRLEKAINPLLDENDLVGFSFILADIIQKCKNIPKSVPFHTRVDAKKAVGYYDRILHPMDLGTMEKKVKEHEYKTIASFMADIQQIFSNSELYNGPPERSMYTSKALEIVMLAKSLVDEQAAQLSELEKNINTTRGTEYEDQEMDDPELETSFMSAGDEEQEVEGEEEDEDNYENDLIMSDESEDDDQEQLLGMNESEWDRRLESSTMHKTGQLHNDLAMSSDSEEDLADAKRPRLDNDDDDTF